MRGLLFISVLILGGCSQSSPPAVAYDPLTFRVDVALLIAQQKYREAVALVRAADLEWQLVADRAGYLVIGEDTLAMPGIDDPLIKYDRNRDWFVPGTSDVIEDAEWQRVATEFARRYNQRRQQLSR